MMMMLLFFVAIDNPGYSNQINNTIDIESLELRSERVSNNICKWIVTVTA